MSALLMMLGFAVLFVVFGVMRPADRRSGGCHGCQHEVGSVECGTECPLLREMDRKLQG
jgi:hypothetical protein